MLMSFYTKIHFHSRINGHENCASLLLGAIDPSIVSCRDDKGRWVRPRCRALVLESWPLFCVVE